MKGTIKLALAGSPNVGKSTIFNALTGGRAWVGNWPGVTVEKKVGVMKLNGYKVEVVDLPGIYSLTAYSIDELIARNFIIEERPDVVVVIVSAINLERSLYLAVSLLELGVNLIVALNMVDLAEREGYVVDVKKLEALLRVPVVPTIAIKGIGIDKLKNIIIQSISNPRRNPAIVDYGDPIEKAISRLCSFMKTHTPEVVHTYHPRWLAIKLLENDRDVVEKVKLLPKGDLLINMANEMRKELESVVGDLEVYMVNQRYAKILEIVDKVVRRVRVKGISVSELLDTVLLDKFLGLPITITSIYLMLYFAYNVSLPLVDLVDALFSSLADYTRLILQDKAPLLASLLADGIITGVGTVLVFTPMIAIFYILVAILEDVGYMARVVFVLDKVLHRFMLPGKAIVPLILGFACNVPAVLSARTIEDENDRKTVIMICPLSTCSARLPVYLIIASAIFGTYAALAITSMYVLSIIFALVIGFLFKSFIFKGPSIGFIMELPPYLMPQSRTVLIKTWERTKRFLTKAGTVILAAAILVWLLSITGPKGLIGPEALEDPALLKASWVGAIGRALQPIFTPMGWDWGATIALFFGFMAKEVVVSTMAMVYGAEETSLGRAILAHFSPLSAYAYMIFVLLYVPCVATMAVIRSEIGLKYAVLTIMYQMVLAYLASLAVMFIGMILGLG
ncbi:MAG: ferrous iron transport protein B [Thermoprotei archaeon]|nr:MAG: ferrous iron transport protein B [Thermoprotei archaeon]RLF25525.1 MAG: ferrous iron transport protein B [Thermoprotei archaeon]